MFPDMTRNSPSERNLWTSEPSGDFAGSRVTKLNLLNKIDTYVNGRHIDTREVGSLWGQVSQSQFGKHKQERE